MEEGQITIADFIIKYGIDRLNNKLIVIDGHSCRMKIKEDEFELHSESDFPSRKQLEDYHKNGNYRFIAVYEENGKEFAFWVYKSCLIEDLN